MDDINHDVEQITPDRPLHGPRRTTIVPLVLTLVVLGVVIGLMALITLVADYSATTG